MPTQAERKEQRRLIHLMKASGGGAQLGMKWQFVIFEHVTEGALGCTFVSAIDPQSANNMCQAAGLYPPGPQRDDKGNSFYHLYGFDCGVAPQRLDGATIPLAHRLVFVPIHTAEERAWLSLDDEGTLSIDLKVY